MRGIVVGSLGLFESSGKTSHTVFHSFSMSFPTRGVVEVGEVAKVHLSKLL